MTTIKMILKSNSALGVVADRRSNVILEKMKRSLGLHCTILRLNTRHVEDGIPLHKSLWISAGEELVSLANPVDVPNITDADKEALQKFVRDMVTQSIVPHMERCITMWNDQVNSLEFLD
jgi:trafficking protein particle complex subunit 8